MRLLLDSHVLIWTACDTAKLSRRVHNALVNPRNEIYFSAVSLWEISLKYALGKLELEGLTPEDLSSAAVKMGFEVLPLMPEVAATFHTLSRTTHKDPFDRMLAWQAICGNLHLVSCDSGMQVYGKQGLKLFW